VSVTLLFEFALFSFV